MCCNKTSVPYSEAKFYNNDLSAFKAKLSASGTVGISSDTVPIIREKRGDWTCMTALNLVCTNVATLTGLGDNISSAGFVYHNMIVKDKVQAAS